MSSWHTEREHMEREKRNAKGAGSFIPQPDGTIIHRKSAGFTEDGKRKVLVVRENSKAACLRAMKIKENEWALEKAAKKVQINTTVTDLCLKHLQYQIDNRELKHKSIDRRECTIENQIRRYGLGLLQVQAVTPIDIERHISILISEKKICPKSIGKVIDVLNAAYAWAVIKGDLQNNPVYSVRPTLKKRLARLEEKGANDADVSVLSQEEEQLFIKEANWICANGAIKYPAGDYLLLLLYTGMRIGEMLALRWCDWKGNVLVIEKSISMAKNRNKKDETENNFIQVEGTTKNQKARNIQLTDEAIEILTKIRNKRKGICEKDRITLTRTGELYTASNMERRMKVIFKNAGISEIQGGLHVLRKTFATGMYEQGARVEEIAAYIGDLESTTRKYYIAIRRKTRNDGEIKQVVMLPGKKKTA